LVDIENINNQAKSNNALAYK